MLMEFNMREIVGDILTTEEVDGVDVVAICFTSNGMVKKDGRSVMGAGVAKLFRDTFKDLDLAYGNLRQITKHNLVTYCGTEKLKGREVSIVAFPTKNDWRHSSTLELIELSALGLKNLIKERRWEDKVILLPRPGCSNGGLQWEQVKRVIEPILPDNVVIITME